MAAINLTYDRFKELAREDVPVVVDFWAPWCSYCRRIGPAYEKLAEEFAGRVILAKVNIDDEPQFAHDERIEVIPTLVLYRGGEALGSVVAPASKGAIEAFILETLEK